MIKIQQKYAIHYITVEKRYFHSSPLRDRNIGLMQIKNISFFKLWKSIKRGEKLKNKIRKKKMSNFLRKSTMNFFSHKIFMNTENFIWTYNIQYFFLFHHFECKWKYIHKYCKNHSTSSRVCFWCAEKYRVDGVQHNILCCNIHISDTMIFLITY